MRPAAFRQTATRTRVGAATTPERDQEADTEGQPGRVGVRQRRGEAPESLRRQSQRRPAPDQPGKAHQRAHRPQTHHGQGCQLARTPGQWTDCCERSPKSDDAGAEGQEVRAGVRCRGPDEPPERQKAETAQHEDGPSIRGRCDQCRHQKDRRENRNGRSLGMPEAAVAPACDRSEHEDQAGDDPPVWRIPGASPGSSADGELLPSHRHGCPSPGRSTGNGSPVRRPQLLGRVVRSRPCVSPVEQPLGVTAGRQERAS